MSNLPNKLQAGDVFKPSVVKAINELIDYCRTHEITGDNRTVRINRHASGITISAVPPPVSGRSGSESVKVDVGATDVVLCQIRGGSAESGFNVNLYANGKNGGVTGMGILFFPELAAGSTLPIGSWVLGHPVMIEIQEGGSYYV